MPKTIDNDVVPIQQSLGAWTAAEEGAKFFANVVNEQSAAGVPGRGTEGSRPRRASRATEQSCLVTL